jgi:phage pi2 protein 07
MSEDKILVDKYEYEKLKGQDSLVKELIELNDQLKIKVRRLEFDLKRR